MILIKFKEMIIWAGKLLSLPIKLLIDVHASTVSIKTRRQFSSRSPSHWQKCSLQVKSPAPVLICWIDADGHICEPTH